MRTSATNSPECVPRRPEYSAAGSPLSARLAAVPWLDETCLVDMENFLKMLADARARAARPDLLGSVICHWAARWLPGLSGCGEAHRSAEGSAAAAWMRKKFFAETLVGVLPPERDALPCGFLLRLLRVCNMVGADAARRSELEARAARQLDQASLGDLMIPAFGHACGTLLDVALVLRLVRLFAGASEDEATRRSGAAALAKVAKLVDCYLAEAAVDANLTLPEFEALAGSLPAHARAVDDGLYRALDTYLKAHPCTTKEERKGLCRLMDARKLSPEASLHAAQNERLPLRAIIQLVFLSDQAKAGYRLADWSGSFSGPRSPAAAVELPARCPSKREVMAQHREIHKLRDDVARLQIKCHSLQAQIDRLVDGKKKKKKKGFLRWLWLFFKQIDVQVEKMEKEEGHHHRTPPHDRRTRAPTTPGWRDSLP